MNSPVYPPTLDKAESSAELAKLAAARVEQALRGASSPTVLFATGASPLGLYRELSTSTGSALHSPSLLAFALDEYLGLPPDHPQSFRQRLLDAVITPLGLDPHQLHAPDGTTSDPDAEATHYEETLIARGEIDLAIVGVGTNGHIAFNEPHTPFDSTTHVVTLTEDTRRANQQAFGGGLEEVPKRAVTVGIATILRAKTIVLLAEGAHKRAAIDRLLHGTPDTAWPVTALQHHPRVFVCADLAALGH